ALPTRRSSDLEADDIRPRCFRPPGLTFPVLRKTVRADGDGSWIEARHQGPRVRGVARLIAGAPHVRAQQDAWDVGGFREYEFDESSTVQLGAIEAENREVRGVQLPDRAVAACLRPVGGSRDVLRQTAQVLAVRFLVDGLRQVRVADELFYIEERAAEVDGETFLLRFERTRHANGMMRRALPAGA